MRCSPAKRLGPTLTGTLHTANQSSCPPPNPEPDAFSIVRLVWGVTDCPCHELVRMDVPDRRSHPHDRHRAPGGDCRHPGSAAHGPSPEEHADLGAGVRSDALDYGRTADTVDHRAAAALYRRRSL